jgi:copper-transporting P-type ATPase V
VSTSPTSPEVVDLTVEGMTCGSCSARVQRTLEKQEGIERADVNFATGRARVYAADALDLDEISRAIDKLGYHLVPPQEQADTRVTRSTSGSRA